MIRTAPQTITNARIVPMFARCRRKSIGANPAPIVTKSPMAIVDFQGVRNLSCTAPKKYPHPLSPPSPSPGD